MFEKVSWNLVFLGAAYMVLSAFSVVFPRLLITKKLARELGTPRAKKYLLYQRVNMFIFGAVLVFIGGLPENLQLWVGIPLLAAVLASFALCNKRTTGLFLPWM